MIEKSAEEQLMDAHQKERDVLFSNEAFVIGVLQAVSGGSLFAALAQSEVLLKLSGRLPFLTFLTLMGIGLISSVLAAYWKHQYKMWDVKARVSDTPSQAQTRSNSAGKYLIAMRRAMFIAVFAVVFSLGQFLLFAWIRALYSITST